MRLTALLAVIVALSGPALAQDEEWIDFIPPEKGVMINFPGEPRAETTTYLSEYGAQLPARVYRADSGKSRYSFTIVDYRPIERLLTEKARTCPRGLERCLGTLGGGAGYWKLDLHGALVYASSQFLKRDAKLTYYWYNAVVMIGGHQLQLTNPDGSRTYASIYMHENVMYIAEATGPESDPGPKLFHQAVNFLDDKGLTVGYTDFYVNGFPKPPIWAFGDPKAANLANPDAIYLMFHPDAEPISSALFGPATPPTPSQDSGASQKQK